jgi:hypothetical protein
LIDHPKIFLLEGGGKTVGVGTGCAEGRRKSGTSEQRNIGFRDLVWCLNPLEADHIEIVVYTRRKDGVLLGGFVEEIIAVGVKRTDEAIFSVTINGNNLHRWQSFNVVAEGFPPEADGGAVEVHDEMIVTVILEFHGPCMFPIGHHHVIVPRPLDIGYEARHWHSIFETVKRRVSEGSTVKRGFGPAITSAAHEYRKFFGGWRLNNRVWNTWLRVEVSVVMVQIKLVEGFGGGVQNLGGGRFERRRGKRKEPGRASTISREQSYSKIFCDVKTRTPSRDEKFVRKPVTIHVPGDRS